MINMYEVDVKHHGESHAVWGIVIGGYRKKAK